MFLSNIEIVRIFYKKHDSMENVTLMNTHKYFSVIKSNRNIDQYLFVKLGNVYPSSAKKKLQNQYGLNGIQIYIRRPRSLHMKTLTVAPSRKCLACNFYCVPCEFSPIFIYCLHEKQSKL